MFASPAGIRPLLLAAAMIASFCTAAHAQDDADKIDWKKDGKWSHLAKYIGTYEYDAILDDKGVKEQLEKALKGQKLDLKKEFEVSAPIGFEDDCLILQGNQQHTADKHRAYLQACINQGNINLAVYDNNKITIYSPVSEYQYLTNGLRSWIYFQNNSPVLTDKPNNVQFVVQAK